MSIKGRIKRLERALPAANGSRPRTNQELWADIFALDAWMEANGYPDHLSILEAGTTYPERFADLIQDDAAYDPRRRALKRYNAALKAFDPNDPDTWAEFREARHDPRLSEIPAERAGGHFVRHDDQGSGQARY